MLFMALCEKRFGEASGPPSWRVVNTLALPKNLPLRKTATPRALGMTRTCPNCKSPHIEKRQVPRSNHYPQGRVYACKSCGYYSNKPFPKEVRRAP